MIKSFADAATKRLFHRERVKKFEAIQHLARRKLDMVHSARILGDLAAVPGNHLEPLHGDREGQHSIRINDQWRICFVWAKTDAYRVEVTDYH